MYAVEEEGEGEQKSTTAPAATTIPNSLTLAHAVRMRKREKAVRM